MAKATEQKKKTAGKKPVAGGTRTVKSYSAHHSSATDEKKKRSTDKVKKDELKAGKPHKQEHTRTPSENWNVVMPFLLGAIALLVILLYVIVFVDKQRNGTADVGAVGTMLYNFLVWLLGPSAYIIPTALLVTAFRWRGITAKGKGHVGLWMQMIFVLILTSAICELFFGGLIAAPAGELWSTYGNALMIFDANDATLVGGFVGGFVALVMYWALKKVLSLAVLILVDLIILMFFVGLTPDRIFAILKARHERKLERSAASLSEYEEARRAEKEAAKAEREAKAALKEEEKRLKKEEEAVRRIREREEKRRAEEDAKLQMELERESEDDTEQAETDASQGVAQSAEDGAVPKDEAVSGSEENETACAEGDRAESEAPAENASPENVSGDDAEDAVSEASEEPSEDAEEGMPIIGETHPLATDLDFGLDENSAKLPRSRLPGDAELFGSFGKEPQKRETVKATVAEDVHTMEVREENDLSSDEIIPAPMQEGTVEPIESAALSEPEYIYPPTALLVEGKPSADVSEFADEIEAKKEELAAVLTSFGVRFRSIEFSRGPTITRYEIQPEPGQRVKAIQNLMDDIALSMAVSGVRFEPSIQGKAAVGIEVPNTTRETVTLRSLVESDTFTSEKSKLTACLGADITGKPVVFDVSKMPHLLVAGATGMGKSVCINSIIVSLMYKATPDEVRLILVDPKKVEFAMYRDMPHLLTPIITDPQKAAGALCSAVSEMEKRFELIERVGARDIAGYKKITAGDPDMPRMCHIVIIIDELADLMMTASNDVEAAIMRIAQKARAAGIHLIIGTQRPSVDVITGTIKANIPSRIACTVASQTDSRTILDSQGAEKLCGRGDMLFAPVGASRPRRVQGSFVSEDEVVRVVNFMINNNGTAVYDEQFMENINIEAERCAKSKKASSEAAMVAECEEDPKLDEAIELAIECGKVATSLLQRRLGVGYGRAAKIIDRMEQLGVVSAADGNKPRQVLITMEEYRERRAAQEDCGENEE
ncbi:MAG: DNA translocase FtsK [Clostridia bacterium]|nr:DNA translocase FtsK [Clostridia bacterium]